MSREVAGNADLDQLPISYRKGHDQPIGWHAGARCRTETPTVTSPKKGGRPSIWQVEAHETYLMGTQRTSGIKLIEMATKICSLCAVQWDCAGFAVSVGEDNFVWAMSLEDLLWLRQQPDPHTIIAKAKRAGRPIQFVVRDARAPKHARAKLSVMSATALLKPRYSGSIEFEKELPIPSIERGIVLIIGAAPKSRVTIMSFDGGGKRGDSVDIMKDATVTETKGKLKIEGTSLRLVREFHLDEPNARTTVTVKLNEKCANCGS